MARIWQIIFSGLAAISEALFWFLAGAASVSELGTLQLFAGMDLIIFFIVLGLSFLFSPVWLTSIAILLGGIPIIFALKNFSASVGIIFLLSILSLIPAWLIQREISIRKNFSVWYNLYRGFPAFFTILSLTFALYFYSLGGAGTFEEIIPQSLFEKALMGVGKVSFVNSLLPFKIPNPDQTVDQALEDQIRSKYGKDFARIPSLEREVLLSEARNTLARNLGLEKIDGHSKVGAIFYKESVQLLEEKFESYKIYLPLAFAIAVFAAFRTSFIFAGWLAVALCWIIYKILLYTRVVALVKREVSQEYIKFN